MPIRKIYCSQFYITYSQAFIIVCAKLFYITECNSHIIFRIHNYKDKPSSIL